MVKVIVSILFTLVFFPQCVFAEIHTAASCSFKDIQTAIDAANTGDTVQIPACDYTFATPSISNVSDNGSGKCRYTTSVAHGLQTGDDVAVIGIATTAGARHSCEVRIPETVTDINTTTFDIETEGHGGDPYIGYGAVYPAWVTVDKSITIQGMGPSNTILNDGSSGVTFYSGYTNSDSHIFQVTVPAYGHVRMTGIKFEETNQSSNYGPVQFSGTFASSTFRLDHCRFENLMGRGTVARIEGLIDNNYYSKSAVASSVQSISVFGNNNAWDSAQVTFNSAVSTVNVHYHYPSLAYVCVRSDFSYYTPAVSGVCSVFTSDKWKPLLQTELNGYELSYYQYLSDQYTLDQKKTELSSLKAMLDNHNGSGSTKTGTPLSIYTSGYMSILKNVDSRGAVK